MPARRERIRSCRPALGATELTYDLAEADRRKRRAAARRIGARGLEHSSCDGSSNALLATRSGQQREIDHRAKRDDRHPYAYEPGHS